MRSDFLGDCAQFPGLAEALNRSQYLIPRLTLDQRQAAIERPLQLAGHRIAPRLVQRLLAGTVDDPDQLPVLQHALMRTFRVWKERGIGDRLDLSDYAEASKSGSALNQHADEIYLDLPNAAKPWAEKLFRCITTKADGKPVRRPTRLRWIYSVTQADSLENRAHIDDAIRRFSLPENSLLFCSTGKRLSPRSVIDISHESLIRKWSRLQGWVEEESESDTWFRDVVSSVLRDASPMRDPDLARVERLKLKNGWNAYWAAQYCPKRQVRFRQVEDFLIGSRKGQEAENRRRLAAQTRERNWLWAAVGLLLLLIVSISLNLYSRAQNRKRQIETERGLLELTKQATEKQNLADTARRASMKAEEELLRARNTESLTAELEKRAETARREADEAAMAARAATVRAADEAQHVDIQAAQAKEAIKQINDLPTQFGAAQKQINDLQTQLIEAQKARETALQAQSTAEAELKKRPTQAEYADLQQHWLASVPDPYSLNRTTLFR
jgi:hypothetical protein